MIPPVVPGHNLVFILIERQHCIVARFVETGPYTFAIERAANWEALEVEACTAVTELVGAITGNDHYPCPAELAERTIWPV